MGWGAAGAALLVLLGLIQLPGDMELPRLVAEVGSAGRLGGLLVLVDLSPALPLMLALAWLAGGRIGGGLALGLCLALVPVTSLLTLLSAYDAGGGSTIILAKGLALGLGIGGMLWGLAGQASLGRVLLAPAVALALWSLATPFAVAASASRIAGDAAFCIARHEADRPIRSWAELRGTSFHTDRSGFKDTSAWFLHGVLLVNRGQGVEAWNWSPRHLRFETIARPGDMVVSPFGTCQPVAGFLRGLPLI